jgi:hypothetical protein
MSLPPAFPVKDRALGLTAVKSGERHVTRFEPDLMLQICERIANGETLTAICKEAEMPHVATVRRWVLSYPEATRAYAAAREQSAHSLEERALIMAGALEAGEVSKDQIRAYDVAMNQLRWSAGKRNPRVYSDKIPPTTAIGIQINTSLDLGSEGLGGNSGLYTITATVVEEQEPRHPNTEASVRDAPPLSVPTVEAHLVRENDPYTLELPAPAEENHDGLEGVSSGGSGGRTVHGNGRAPRGRHKARSAIRSNAGR